MTLMSKLLVTGRTPRVMAGLLCFAVFLACSGSAIADTSGALSQKVALGSGDAPIAVVYPDIEPYRSVFEQIITGIEDKARDRVARFAVAPNVDIDELKSNLRRKNVKVVIALGQQGMKIATRLDRDMGVVVGGVIAPPANEMRDVPVNSLSPAPALLLLFRRVQLALKSNCPWLPTPPRWGARRG